MTKMSGTIVLNDASRQGRSMTPSSSGLSRNLNQRSIMTGLQDAVQEYLKAPPANTLPQPLFASSSSVCLEEGMRQMSGIVTGMSDWALSDQGSQGSRDSRKNMWGKAPAKIATPKKRWEKEEDENSNVLFYYLEFFDLLYDR